MRAAAEAGHGCGQESVAYSLGVTTGNLICMVLLAGSGLTPLGPSPERDIIPLCLVLLCLSLPFVPSADQTKAWDLIRQCLQKQSFVAQDLLAGALVPDLLSVFLSRVLSTVQSFCSSPL